MSEAPTTTETESTTTVPEKSMSDTIIDKGKEATDSTEKVETKVETKEEPKEEPTKPIELTMPKDSKLADEVMDTIKATAKENGWDQKTAQAFLDSQDSAINTYETAQQEKLSTLNDKTWKDELMNDPEVGGLQFEQSGHLAHRAAETFFGTEFADELKTMKLNHHPKLFKGLCKIGKAMQDDGHTFGGTKPAEKSTADKFYGSADK